MFVENLSKRIKLRNIILQNAEIALYCHVSTVVKISGKCSYILQDSVGQETSPA